MIVNVFLGLGFVGTAGWAAVEYFAVQELLTFSSIEKIKFTSVASFEGLFPTVKLSEAQLVRIKHIMDLKEYFKLDDIGLEKAQINTIKHLLQEKIDASWERMKIAAYVAIALVAVAIFVKIFDCSRKTSMVFDEAMALGIANAKY